MSRNQRPTPKGWRVFPLGEVCDLMIGRTPSRKRNDYWRPGVFPWATIRDMSSSVVTETRERITELAVEETKIPLVAKGTVLLSFKLSLGKVALTGTDLYTNEAIMAVTPKNDRLIQNDYLFFAIRSLDIKSQSQEAVKGRTVNKEILQRMPILVPSLPVQERIVQILQKSDEIRHKRQEALTLADAVLPAAYRDLFGDPDTNPYGWPVKTLGEYLEDSRYGTSERTSAYGDGDPVLRIPNVINRTIDTTDLKFLRVGEAERKLLLLSEGDLLVVRTNGNKDYVGRCAVFDRQEEFLFASYLIRLRLQREHLNPHYVVAFLSTTYGRREIDRNSRTSAGQYNISSTGLRAIRIPVPPMSRQLKFLDQYEQWKEAKSRLELGYREADATFHALFSVAFSGKLTGEWATANADWIAGQVKLRERLPRLLLLNLIRERVARSEKAVLMTALMKYAFLFQMEGNGHRRFYHFVPYHYGPFAKQLYEDLQGLVGEGVVRVENDDDEEKTRITLVDMAKADKMLDDVPEEARADVASIIDTYGALDHRNLLKTVYKKYPAYAKKSKIRRGPESREISPRGSSD